ncbi:MULTISPECIES: UDP-N-acetylglucosamine--LPS N-acetylglucosamine transferase [unclassified Rothia (in: high G+C Gram-positive bacteria)]|uniref:UDP-N-acetylglucosamine--LPS N-acetylglucosamine transferase n=1 Tax=unclassified Rothia (in: high G+C Gram-positive bacteria) TaxID=2689056 RepID=UPI00195F01BD|nr:MULTISPECIES: UDP-N-acetylglucosamine--LPS N-acetylglucosamine transferase [unclassified Rothia (in: high G+C Gram-positive bacteria)]MBM7051386.1 UDP-N-acetylglucosamine--LPS N-acetylglucosamine transferase [Rothia sp. ZJ1223]QRZ61178.1 UDP-N-acetylglucosamine--LPS N-acetylglucosamine transferase [Rothia sp. ZJ932]
MKIILVASAGGHLAQLIALDKFWKQHERSWVTFRLPEVEAALSGEKVDWAYFPTTRNIPNAIRNLGVAWKVLRRERPDTIISSGAAVAVPFFIVGKLLGMKTVFMEPYDRITMPTLSARMCYPMTDLFVVQWDEQQKAFPESVNIGAVL